MSRTSRGERTHAEILSAARSLLLEMGVDRLSLREVARQAGLAPSAVYNHFKDKDTLIIALAIESVGSLAGHLHAVGDGPAVERLVELGRAYAHFALEHPQEYQVIFDCLVNPPHTWTEYTAVADPFVLIVETCAQGLRDGELVDHEGTGASGMAFALWTMVDGFAHLRLKHLAAVDAPYEAMLDAALATLIRGFSANDSTPATERTGS